MLGIGEDSLNSIFNGSYRTWCERDHEADEVEYGINNSQKGNWSIGLPKTIMSPPPTSRDPLLEQRKAQLR
jgi:hypothetical protein